MISVLMAVHADTPEKVEWLGEAVASVREQDFQDVEVIVVDDCSPLPLGELDARVVRTTSKQGPAAARNTAVALARYDALVALDGDDLFASPRALSEMWAVWTPEKVVYGDLQQYNLVDGAFQRGKTVVFPHYTFQHVLKPQGLIPVTALHSRECHVAAGGWKPELEHGLEDVEYWIAAGAAGFCGLKVDTTVLLYRRHGASRTVNMRSLRMEGTARAKIYEMHQDLYEGRYPVGCCGGGSRAPVPSAPNAPAPTSLTTFREDERVWVRYNGKRTGAFGMVGPASRYTYTVDGTAHVFQVYVNDVQLFRRSGRGQDFSVGVAPPESEPEPDVVVVKRAEVAPPVMAEIERLDDVAMEASPNHQPNRQPNHQPGLSAIDLGSHKSALEAQGWTVEKLANASVGDLTPIRGVGIVTAAKIIDAARAV